MTESTGSEPARMSPVSRFFNVFTSPGAVFEDVRRDARGWWLPLVAVAILVGIFATAYVGRYDIPMVLREQLRDNGMIKLVGLLQGPEARDKAIEQGVRQVSATPVWQLEVSQWAQVPFGMTLAVWFFTFLYGLLALLMGWLPKGSGPRLFLSLLFVLGAGIVLLGVGGVLQVVQARSIQAAQSANGPLPAPPAWMSFTGLALALVATAILAAGLVYLAREAMTARVLNAVCLGLAPTALFALVGLVLVFIKTPDATPFEQLVPADLSTILQAKSGVLAAIGSSLGIFSLWSLALTVIGLARGLGKSTGAAAAVVLGPWAVWIVIKVAFAALVG